MQLEVIFSTFRVLVSSQNLKVPRLQQNCNNANIEFKVLFHSNITQFYFSNNSACSKHGLLRADFKHALFFDVFAPMAAELCPLKCIPRLETFNLFLDEPCTISSPTFDMQKSSEKKERTYPQQNRIGTGRQQLQNAVTNQFSPEKKSKIKPESNSQMKFSIFPVSLGLYQSIVQPTAQTTLGSTSVQRS